MNAERDHGKEQVLQGQNRVVTSASNEDALWAALDAAEWGEPVRWLTGDALRIKVGERPPVQVARDADGLERECLWRGALDLMQETVTRSAHHWIVTYLLSYPGGSVRVRYVQPSDGGNGWFDLPDPRN